MSSVLTEIIGIITGGLTTMATNIGQGLQNFVQSIFVTSTTSTSGDTTYSLTVFGGVVCIFAGIGLAVSLGRLVLGWVMSLGGRNRA